MKALRQLHPADSFRDLIGIYRCLHDTATNARTCLLAEMVFGGADVTKNVESKRCQTKHEIMNCYAFIFVYLLYVILHCWMLRVGSCVRRSGDPESLFHIFD